MKYRVAVRKIEGWTLKGNTCHGPYLRCVDDLATTYSAATMCLRDSINVTVYWISRAF